LKEPENQIVLFYKYTSIKRFLDYSIHEVPSSVLCGEVGAEKEHMPDMKKNLNEFAAISKKLGKDDEYLIQKCTNIYIAWEQYLEQIENYGSFMDYVEEQEICW